MKARMAVVLVAMFVAGCSVIPAAVDRPVSDPQPLLGQVQSTPDQFRDQVVRWGGTIVRIDNRSDTSVIEVVARPLQSNARPEKNGMSPGRFLIVTANFIDPEIFKAGSDITATGSLEGIEVRKIGEHDYRYPVLRADGYHLWAPLPERRAAHPDPFWGHSWMYHRGPYPYWYHPHYYIW